jgi:hypothetical protein
MAIPVVLPQQPLPEFQIATPDTFLLIGFDLQQGVTYTFTALGRDDAGGTLANPDLAITDTDANGNPVHALAYANDSFLSHDPVLNFTAPLTGQYDVIVGGLGGTGTFQLQGDVFLGPVMFAKGDVIS